MKVDLRLRNGMRLWGSGGLVMCARGGRLDWVAIRDLVVGDWVGLDYGGGFATDLAPIGELDLSPAYGSQKQLRIPTLVTEDLALLLGMYASEGHTTTATYTVVITNSVPAVLHRAADLWLSCFGLTARIEARAGKCPQVIVSSKSLVEVMAGLRCGRRASEKRIPDAIMDSPKPVVLSFLQGLFLDAYTSLQRNTGKWAICLDSPVLLDQLQLLLRQLGIVTGRNSKHNATYDKSYEEVFACGGQAQDLLRLVTFLEPAKARRAEELLKLEVDPRRNGADVIPLVTGRELYGEIPKGRAGRGGVGSGVSLRWRHLVDPRTAWPSRHTVRQLAEAGHRLPADVAHALADEIHFSQVWGK